MNTNICDNDMAKRIHEHFDWLESLPKQWSLGDVVMLPNPLAKRNKTRKENDPWYVEAYEYAIVLEHRDNKDLVFCVVVDNGQFNIKSEYEVDFPLNRCLARAYPTAGLWISLNNLDLKYRSNRISDEAVGQIQKRLSEIASGKCEPNNDDDPLYEDYVWEFQKAIHAMESE